MASRAWWTHREVLDHLRVHARTLRAAMEVTPDHVTKPWVNYGSQWKPRFRWRGSEIDVWWREVNEWRINRSRPRVEDSEPTRRSEPATPVASKSSPQAPSNPRSRPKDGSGNLVALVRSLTSKRS